MRTAIQGLLTPQGKVEAAYIDQITARINTDVLFKRLTHEKSAEQWISESKAAIGK